MAGSKATRRRSRGGIEELSSGALRAYVYAGVDPVSGRRHYLRETVPAGPDAQKAAEKALRRLSHEVDEQRSPRTNATLDQLLDRHLETLDVGRTTHRMYTRYLEKHVRPFIGRLKAGAVGAESLDSLYAELRRCRDHCTSKRGTDHRTPREHVCDGRCRPHECRPLAPATVRHIHFVLNAAYAKGVRWRWVSINPVEFVSAPAKPPPDPQPPSAEEAARILNEAWRDPDWGALVWLTMTTGARRGELCGLRWSHVDLAGGALTIRRAISQDGTFREEKDTKTHQQRRLVLDPETVAILGDHQQRCRERAESLGLDLVPDAFVFSLEPDGGAHLVPGSVSQRYGRLAVRLGIETHLHSLRHYSATELIAGGVDVRTVAGRLGHSGGGATTLRVYSAWLAEADQRAAGGIAGRMPARPTSASAAERAMTEPRTPRDRLAVELRKRVLDGLVADGDHLPGIKVLAAEKGLSVGTVHRAFELLREWGLLVGPPGERPTVRAPSVPSTDASEPEVDVPSSAAPRGAPAAEYWTLTLRGPDGRRFPPRIVTGSLSDPGGFRGHLLAIARIEDPDHTDSGEDWIGRYEIEVAPLDDAGRPPAVLRW